MLLALALLLPLVQKPAAHAAPTFDRAKLADLARHLARSAIDESGVPGVAIAIAQKDDVFFAEGFGHADSKSGAPVSPTTRFPIGTLTRQFTAAAVLQLVEQKKIDLDDLLSKHVLEAKSFAPTVTVRQVLSNTAGIPGYAALLAKHPEAAKPHQDEEDFFKMFADVPLAYEPGTGFDLDNAGYVILSLLVQRTTGQIYFDYLRDKVLAPAGLKEVDFCGDGARATGRAVGCERKSDERMLEMPLPSAAHHSTQSLCANVKELVEWQRATVGRLVMTDPSSRTMMTPTKLADGNMTNYGYALEMSKLRDYKRYAHSGGGLGCRVSLTYYSLPEVTIAIEANCASAPVDRIERELAQIVLSITPAPADDVPLEQPALDRFPGTYQIGAARWRALVRDGHVWLASPAGEEKLVAQNDSTFLLDSDHEVRVTFEAQGAKSAWFEILRGGYPSRAHRVD